MGRLTAGTRRRALGLAYVASVSEGLALTAILFMGPLHARTSLGESSMLLISLIPALPSVAIFFTSNLWGAIADVTGRIKPWLLVGLAAYGGCLLALIGSDNGPSFVGIVALFSLAFSALTPMLQSYATGLGRESREGWSLGAVFTFQGVGWFLGGILMGWSYDPNSSNGMVPVLLSAGVWVCLLTIVAWRWMGDYKWSIQEEGGRSSVLVRWKALAKEQASVYRIPGLGAMLIGAFLIATANWGFFGLYSIYFTEKIGASVPLAGWSLSLSTLFGITFFPLVGWITDRWGGVKVFLVTAWAYVGLYLGFCYARSPYFVTVLFVIPLYPAISVSATAVTARLGGVAHRVGALGALFGSMACARACGALVSGWAADTWGLSALPVVGLTFVSLGAVFFSIALLTRRIEWNT